MVGLIAAWALAGEPVKACEGPWPAPEQALSVAWVSPLRDRAGNNRWLTLTPTAELRAYGRGEAKGSVARVLQHLGARKRSKEPRRAYKVVVFDVPVDALCRPLGDHDGGAELVDGVRACVAQATRLREAHDGCGRLVDHGGGATTPVFRARWRDVVGNGFCVLPAERFLER